MRVGTLVSGMLLASALLGSVAAAQVPRGFNPAATKAADEAAQRSNAGVYERAVESLRAGNFTAAEAAIEELLKNDRMNPEFNLMLGVAMMGQERWTDARRPLERAAKKAPKSPDARSRLAVTYIKLGETRLAEEQRAALVKLADACKGTCKDAPWIASGLQMIDNTVGPALPVVPDAN